MTMTGTAPTELNVDCDCDCHHEDQHCEHCCLDPDVGFCADCTYYLERRRDMSSNIDRGTASH